METDTKENSTMKICPFNSQPCMKCKCMLFDTEARQCEFKNLCRFIGECCTDLIGTIEENKKVNETDD